MKCTLSRTKPTRGTRRFTTTPVVRHRQCKPVYQLCTPVGLMLVTHMSSSTDPHGRLPPNRQLNQQLPLTRTARRLFSTSIMITMRTLIGTYQYSMVCQAVRTLSSPLRPSKLSRDLISCTLVLLAQINRRGCLALECLVVRCKQVVIVGCRYTFTPTVLSPRMALASSQPGKNNLQRRVSPPSSPPCAACS